MPRADVWDIHCVRRFAMRRAAFNMTVDKFFQ